LEILFRSSGPNISFENLFPPSNPVPPLAREARLDTDIKELFVQENYRTLLLSIYFTHFACALLNDSQAASNDWMTNNKLGMIGN
jgi:hypothetical protein